MKFYYPLQIDRYTKNNEDPGAHHSGQNWSIDFAAPEGTELYAIASGTVVVCRADNTYDAKEEGNTGKCVSIKFNLEDKGTLYATYMHMSRVDVQLNQAVQIGDRIGLVGDTGYSFGAHLHLQISTSEWGSNPVYVGAVDGEDYRFNHPDTMSLVEKLFRFLSVNYDDGHPDYGDWEMAATNGENDISIIYNGLRALGFSRSAAIGAIANMRHESGWITHIIGYNSIYFINYGTRSKEELLDYMNSAVSGEDLYNKIQNSYNGYSKDVYVGYGLTQFTSEQNLINLYNEHIETGLPYDTLGVQLRAFKDVLMDNNYWDKVNTISSPADAAEYLCRYYERPSNLEENVINRRNEASALAERSYFYD